MIEKRINIDLSNDQALVLFDWLARFNERNDHDFDDQAEQKVLWDVEAVLEKSLGELFSDNYKELLAEARARVRDSVE